MPVRARIIGPAADDQLSLFLRKLKEFNGAQFIPECLAATVPTVQVLLSHASTGESAVEPKANPYAPRAYNVDSETQERIDGNTIVGVDGNAIRVGTGEGSDHDRPLVPLGGLTQHWRAAIARRFNGIVRRKFAFNQAVGFLQGALAAGPVQAYGFGRRAREAGIKARALREAKASLGVKLTGGRGKKGVLSL